MRARKVTLHAADGGGLGRTTPFCVDVDSEKLSLAKMVKLVRRAAVGELDGLSISSCGDRSNDLFAGRR